MAYHTKDELHALIDQMSPRMLQDGIVVDCPKKRRRSQITDRKRITLQWDTDQMERFAAAMEAIYQQFHDVGVARDVMINRLNTPAAEEHEAR